jgi:hypothetical protein
MTGTEQTAEIVDLGAYRARRSQSLPGMSPAALAPSRWFMAVPVFMPLMITWVPVWRPADAAHAGGTRDE